MRNVLPRFNLRFNIQIAVAMALAIFLGYYFELKYAAAAGIVTLATVQNTRKETLRISIKRVIGFIAMIVLAIIIFNTIGFNVIAFGLLVLLLGIFCTYFDMGLVLSSNAVMATHFLDTGSTSQFILLNEIYLFIIGVGIGVLVNIITPVGNRDFDSIKKKLDEDMKYIFILIAKKLRNDFEVENKVLYQDVFDIYFRNKITSLREFIKMAENSYFEEAENLIFQEDKYLVEYFYMRLDQLVILEKIYDSTKKIEIIRPEAERIASYIEHIAKMYKETNNVGSLIEEGYMLLADFRDSELPKDRPEFETRARLYMILEGLISCIEVKYFFVRGLSDEVKMKYWIGDN